MTISMPGDVMLDVALLAVAAGVIIGFLRSGRRLRRQIAARERVLEQTHDNLETALASMANGLCLFDADNRLVMVNARLLSLLRIPAGAVRPGMSFRDYLAQRHAAGNFGDRDFEEVYAERSARIARNQPMSHLDVTGDGRMIAILHRPTPDGGWIATYDDVTELRQAERARAEAQADLLREREKLAKEASRAKSEFLAMMSHEIRTPMNAVLGLAGCLLDGRLTPEQHRMVETIHESGTMLLRILNDILDFSKLEAGRMTFERAAFSPAALMHSVVSVLGPQAAAKGVRMDVECAPGLPEGLIGDAGRIRQILLNLTSNAAKFTDAGSIVVRAECLGRDGSAATIRWTVRDTGIGIPADRIATLFGEFVQADTSITRRFGGSGLGLAISKRLATQMGGSIDVESLPGQGTTFRVELALPVSDSPAEAATRAADVTPDFIAWLGSRRDRLRVLVAEDNPTNQLVARQMLKGLDVQLDVVGDGREAVQAAIGFAYDVIFMDMRMPEMDGLRAARLIRQQGGRLDRVPIIALTANAFAEDIKACFDAGMNQFLPKPVSRERMLTAIMQALNAAGDGAPTGVRPAAPADQARPAAPADQARAAAPAPPDCDWSLLEELRHEIGPDALADMLAVFEADAPARLASLAAHHADRAIVLREAHSLRGAAAAAGASALAARAGAIEAAARAGEIVAAGEAEAAMAAFAGFVRQVQSLRAARPAAPRLVQAEAAAAE